MNLLRADFVPAMIFAVVFPAIFAGGELLRRWLPCRPELSRKFVHLCGGIAALFFPFVLHSPVTVLLLALLFAGFILLTKRKGVLQSVHGIDRPSAGAVYFPVAITLLYFLGCEQQVFYVISVLTLTVSDSLAALVGTRYGAITYEVEEGTKSLEGSLVFFFITFLCVHLPLLLLTDMDRLQSVLIALVIAILVTGFEAISPAGSDNIVVPLGTFFILVKMAGYSLTTTIEHTGVLFVIIAVSLMLTFLQKVFKPSGLIGMILVNYAAWSLCGFSWLLPLLLAQSLLYVLVLQFRHQVPEDITNYQIRMLFYAAIVPVILIFIASAGGGYQRLYLPYLAAVVSQIALIFAYFLSIAAPDGKGILVRRSMFLQGLVCNLIATTAIAVPPLSLYSSGTLWQMTGVVVLAALAAFSFFHLVSTHLLQSDQRNLMRQRIRMASSAFAAFAVFLAQLA